MVQELNEWLATQEKTPHGDPVFRLVLAGDQRELRRGEFNHFVNDSLVRVERGVREVLKYPWIKPDRYVMEMWQPPEKVFHEDLPNSIKGSYEPLYVFESADGVWLRPIRKAVEFILYNVRNPVRVTAEERINECLEREEKEQRFLEEQLEIVSSVGSALRTGEGTGYGTKGRGNKNARSAD